MANQNTKSKNQAASYRFIKLSRGVHPINQSSEALWDAHNIRITGRDGESYCSITNEKSTKELYNLCTITGDTTYYIGHEIINNYLVLLLTTDTYDYIIRIDLSNGFCDGSYEDTDIRILYKGDLNFNVDHPAQSVSDYETELIQKVYWTDGINRPRIINIAKPELQEADYDADVGYSNIYNDAPFDFVCDLKLEEEVSVEKMSSTSGGLFPAGVIQYACTYGYKYQQETNVFYTSPLLYVSYSDRGGDAETSINAAFKITVDNVDTTFDYVRIYSILRTSLNGTPVVKRIIDLELDEDTSSVSFIDTNTTGEDVDSNKLLYIGGKDIIAGCIEAKDNTLFLGDITYQRRELSYEDYDGYENIADWLQTEYGVTVNIATKEIYLGGGQNYNNAFYDYANQLSAEDVVSYFKNGESYRLGIQFQYKTGEWSEPIFLTDQLVECDPPYIKGDGLLRYLEIPYLYVEISDVTTFTNLGYKKVRGVVVFPEAYERNIICQGIVCPTVFQAGARLQNAPFAMSSWFLRPMGVTPTSSTSNTGLSGSVAEWRHLYPITSGRSSGAEVQNMDIAEDYKCAYAYWSSAAMDSKYEVLTEYDEWLNVINEVDGKSYKYLVFDHPKNVRSSSTTSGLSTTYANLNYVSKLLNNNLNSAKGFWYVDQSVCTFYSPDITFDDSLQVLLDMNGNYSINIVGVIPFSECYGDINIDMSTIQANPEALGKHESIVHSSSNGGAGLISGLFFQDSIIDDYSSTFKFLNADDDDWETHYICDWLVYLWHRTGSLNNDITRPEDMGTRTAELNTKVISNIRFSKNTAWLQDSVTLDIDSANIKIFNSDEQTLVKLIDSYNKLGSINYYGNVDILNPSHTPFKLVKSKADASGEISVAGSLEVNFNTESESVSYFYIPNLSSNSSTNYIYVYDNSTYLDVDITLSEAYSLISTAYPITVVLSSAYLSGSNGDTLIVIGTIDCDAEVTIDWANVLDINSATNTSETFSLNGLTITFEVDGASNITNALSGSGAFLGYVELDSERYGSAVSLYFDSVAFTTPSLDNWLTYTEPTTVSTKVGSYLSTLYYLMVEGDVSYHIVQDGYSNTLGDYYRAMTTPTEGVRMKYKTTPHVVFALDYFSTNYSYTQRKPMPELNIDESVDSSSIYYEDNNYTYNYGQYWLSDTDESAYIKKGILTTPAMKYGGGSLSTLNMSYLWLCEITQSVENKFGGTSKDALLNNVWLPAGPAVSLVDGESATVTWEWGDTWYQRYDCLKTYPFTTEDTNQVVEIGSFLCESKTNIDGRYDRNRGLIDNTTISPTNFNLLNTVYSQKDNFFTYQIMDEDYYKVNRYQNQIWWTSTKSPGATNDEWTNVHMASTMDLDGSNGAIKAIVSSGNYLYGLQESAVVRIEYNSKAVIGTEDGVPVEISNSNKVDSYTTISDTVGCQDKFSAIATTKGIYFIDNNNCTSWFMDSNGQSLSNLKDVLGSLYWFRENQGAREWLQINEEETTGLVNSRLFYDPKYLDVYFVPGIDYNNKREALCYNEEVQGFTSLLGYGGAVFAPYNGRTISIARNAETSDLTLWENWADDVRTYNTIFNEIQPYSFSFICNDFNTVTKVFNAVEMRTDSYDYNDTTLKEELRGGVYSIAEQAGQPFNYIRVSNEYQDTGRVAITERNLRKKFRVWRTEIPRQANTRARIRNLWAKITFGNDDPDTKFAIVHDLNVLYTL